MIPVPEPARRTAYEAKLAWKRHGRLAAMPPAFREMARVAGSDFDAPLPPYSEHEYKLEIGRCHLCQFVARHRAAPARYTTCLFNASWAAGEAHMVDVDAEERAQEDRNERAQALIERRLQAQAAVMGGLYELLPGGGGSVRRRVGRRAGGFKRRLRTHSLAAAGQSGQEQMPTQTAPAELSAT